MNKKAGNFFERYIDKIVLVVVGILSLLLLWIFIFSSPYAVEYGGKKFSTSQLDVYIKQQSEDLKDKLNDSAIERHYVQGRGKEFFKKLECSLNSIPNNICYPLPCNGSDVVLSTRFYILPNMEELKVTDVAVEPIRTVVHMPIDEVDIQRPYSSVETELEDIDLVTVEASVDISRLYNDFQQSFTGRRVKANLRDDNLAQPVFAAVELQRQHLIGNDKWSKWHAVPRTKVDDFKKMLDIPQKVQNLKYQVSLLMSQFADFDVQSDILQPESYEFASSATEWLTPVLHKEYEKLVKQENDQTRRKELEMKKQARQRELEAKKQQKQGSRRGGGMGMGPGFGGPGGGGGGGGRRSRSQRSRGRNKRQSSRRSEDKYGGGAFNPRKAAKDKKERTIDDVYREFDALFFEEETSLAEKRDPLVFWAHDDTIEPGNSYQYRIRVGVFNPMASQNWFIDEQKHLKDEVILWSGFSDVTEVVSIPKMVHLFPLDISEQTSDSQKTVNIQVSKFYHGKWRSEQFEVKPGEIIGTVVAKEDKEEETKRDREVMTAGFGLQQSDSEKIDYTTSAVLVDVIQSNDWAGANVLRPREYDDVLYTEDGEIIKYLAVRNRNWSSKQQKQFNIIKAAEDEKIQVYFARGQGKRRKGSKRQAVPSMPMGPMGPGFMGPMGPGMMGPMGPGFMGPR